MDSTHATRPAVPGEHMRVTPELRWHGETGASLCVPRRPTLQQKWVSDDAARFEWRDVPLVFN